MAAVVILIFLFGFIYVYCCLGGQIASARWVNCARGASRKMLTHSTGHPVGTLASCLNIQDCRTWKANHTYWGRGHQQCTSHGFEFILGTTWVWGWALVCPPRPSRGRERKCCLSRLVSTIRGCQGLSLSSWVWIRIERWWMVEPTSCNPSSRSPVPSLSIIICSSGKGSQVWWCTPGGCSKRIASLSPSSAI